MWFLKIQEFLSRKMKFTYFYVTQPLVDFRDSVWKSILEVEKT